jgi:excinuclease ABC subunit A
VIEHNLDVIKTADWVIDLGPGGGVNGGQIIAEGPPETIAEVGISATGQYLRPILERASVKPKVVEAKPRKPSRSSRARSRGVDEPSEDEFPDLVAAK